MHQNVDFRHDRGRVSDLTAKTESIARSESIRGKSVDSRCVWVVVVVAVGDGIVAVNAKFYFGGFDKSSCGTNEQRMLFRSRSHSADHCDDAPPASDSVARAYGKGSQIDTVGYDSQHLRCDRLAGGFGRNMRIRHDQRRMALEIFSQP